MKVATIYELATGRIVRVVSGKHVEAKVSDLDPATMGVIYARPAHMGQIVKGGGFVDPDETPDEAMARLRAERDRRLAATDWTQLGDVPAATRRAWRAYRQALRDITKGDPFAPVWPVPPA